MMNDYRWHRRTSYGDFWFKPQREPFSFRGQYFGKRTTGWTTPSQAVRKWR